MRADHLSYKRATNVAWLGVAIQLVMGIALLVYGLLEDDSAGVTASIFILLGSVVWLTLAILFDQHRRERIEAIEQENFAEQDLVGSNVFEDAGADLLVAARRLDSLYKYMIPVVSLAMGAALIGAGLLRFGGGPSTVLEGLNRGGSSAGAGTGSHGLAIAFGIGIAVIGFVFARFTSGMARAKVWENLRGGAVFSVGSALFGLAIAVAQFADLAGFDSVLRWLNPTLSLLMIVFGSEIFLNFALDIYRPRPAGEYPRPAFDSRLLGFIAAPDRIAESINDAINYQFGYEVTGSWFYKLLSRSFLWLVLFGGVAMWLMTSFAVIEPHQRGLLLVNGSPTGQELGPGLHVKPPWPFGKVVVPEFVRTETEGQGRDAIKHRIVERTATGVRVLELASEPSPPNKPLLWTNEELKETLMVVQPSPSTPGSRAESQIGRGLSLAAVRVPLYFSIKPGGVESYLLLGTTPEMRDSILLNVAQRELFRELASRRIDEVIGAGRNEIRASLQARISKAFDGLNPDETGTPRGAGVQILFVGFEDARPPQDTAKAFELVLEASQKSSKVIIQARQTRAEKLAEVIGSVSQAEEVIGALEQYDAQRPNTTGQSAPEQADLEQEIALREMIEQSGGKASDTIVAARAERWQTHMRARSMAEQYAGKLSAFQAAPQIYENRMRFAAIAEAIKDLRLYVVDDDVIKRIRVDLMDKYTGSSVFEPQNEGDL